MHIREEQAKVQSANSELETANRDLDNAKRSRLDLSMYVCITLV